MMLKSIHFPLMFYSHIDSGSHKKLENYIDYSLGQWTDMPPSQVIMLKSMQSSGSEVHDCLRYDLKMWLIILFGLANRNLMLVLELVTTQCLHDEGIINIILKNILYFIIKYN